MAAARKTQPQPSLYNPQPFQPPATAPQVPVPIQQMQTPLVEVPQDWPRYEGGDPKVFEDMTKEEADFCLDTFKTVDPKSAVANESIENRLTSIAQGKPIYSAWQAQDATVYDAIMERFGASDKLKMTSLRRVMPDQDHLVPPSMPSVPSHAAFVQWLRDNCWTGNREKFQYGLRLGAHHLFTGSVEFSDNDIQKAIYRRRVEEAGRSATPRPGTPGGTLLATPLQPGPPQLAAPPPAASPPSGVSIEEAIRAERARWEAERAAEQRERGLLDTINRLEQQLQRPAAPAPAPGLPPDLASVLGRIDGRLAQLENGPTAPAPSRQPPAIPDNWPDPPEGHVYVWSPALGKHECRRLNAEPPRAPIVEARPASPPPVPDNWPDPPEGHVYVWNAAKGKHECRRLNAEPVQTSTALVHAPAQTVEVAKPQSITDMARQVVSVAEEAKTALNLVTVAVGGDPLFAPPAKAAAALAASPAEPEAKEEKEKPPTVFHEEGGVLFRKDAKGNPLMSMEDLGLWDIIANGQKLGQGVEWASEFFAKKKTEDAELALKTAEAAKAAEEAKALALKNALLEQELMAKRAETVVLQRQAVASLQGSTPTDGVQVSSGEPPST